MTEPADADAERTWRDRYHFWGLFSLCVVGSLAILMSVVPLGSFSVSGEVTASAVTLGVSRRQEASRVVSAAALPTRDACARVTGAAPVAPAAAPADTPARVAPAIDLRAQRATLSRLSMAAGAELGIVASEDEDAWPAIGASLALALRGNGSIELEAASPPGQPAVVAGDAALRQRTDDGEPLALRLATLGSAQPVPLRLTLFCRIEPLRLPDLAVRSMQFGRELPVDFPDRFASSIVGGKVNVLVSSATYDLSPGAGLALGTFDGIVTGLASKPDGLHLYFTGRATDLKVGPGGFLVDRRPTWLDAVQNSIPFKTTIASLVFVLAVIPAWLNYLQIRERLRPDRPPTRPE